MNRQNIQSQYVLILDFLCHLIYQPDSRSLRAIRGIKDLRPLRRIKRNAVVLDSQNYLVILMNNTDIHRMMLPVFGKSVLHNI